ncbi:MAG: hypothetical protein WCD37_10550 [Chloroflexia bacterium]
MGKAALSSNGQEEYLTRPPPPPHTITPSGCTEKTVARDLSNRSHPRLTRIASDSLLSAALESLHPGERLEVRLAGASMRPFIRSGELARIGPPPARPRRGTVLVLTRDDTHSAGFIIHRVIGRRAAAGRVQIRTKGDAMPRPDGWWDMSQALGEVVCVYQKGRWVPLDRGRRRVLGWLYSWISPFSTLLYPLVRRLRNGLGRSARRIGRPRLPT